MKKVVLTCVLGSLMVLTNVTCSPVVQAADLVTKSQDSVAQKLVKKVPKRDFLRPVLSEEEIISSLHREYNADKNEIKALLQNGFKYGELNTAYHYAVLANTNVTRVLLLHKEATWGRVRVLLGLDAGKYAERENKFQLEKLSTQNILDVAKINHLMKDGYPLNDIKKAAVLSLKSNKNIKDILDLKTVVKDWSQIQKELKIEPEKVENGNFRRRGQRTGAGFAGLHTRNMTKERALKILSKDYLFTEQELAPLFDKLGFEALEDVCLHAYMGEVSLAQVMQMREKLSWKRIKHQLGLTPSVYFERCVAYQARRLNERMGIPVRFTKQYMHAGFPMHYVNSAYLLAQKAHLPAEQVIMLKNPHNSWNDVALKIGLTIEDCQEAKNKISLEFGRHEL